jgi:hypothetical protein
MELFCFPSTLPHLLSCNFSNYFFFFIFIILWPGLMHEAPRKRDEKSAPSSTMASWRQSSGRDIEDLKHGDDSVEPLDGRLVGTLKASNSVMNRSPATCHGRNCRRAATSLGDFKATEFIHDKPGRADIP